MEGTGDESDNSSCSEPTQLKPCKGSKASRKARLCQAKGCTVDLHQLNKPYNKKKRLCMAHIKADAVERCDVEGLWRFCQQCGKLEPLANFEGAKRSCTWGLQRRRETSSALTKSKKQQQQQPCSQQQQQQSCSQQQQQQSQQPPQQQQQDLPMSDDQFMQEQALNDAILQQMLLIQQKQAELAAAKALQQQQQLLSHASLAARQSGATWQQQQQLLTAAAAGRDRTQLTTGDVWQSLLADSTPTACDPIAAAAASRNDLVNSMLQDMAAVRPMTAPPRAAAATGVSHEDVITSLLHELTSMRPGSAAPATAGIQHVDSNPLPAINPLLCHSSSESGHRAAVTAPAAPAGPSVTQLLDPVNDAEMAALDEIEKVIEQELLAAIQLQHHLAHSFGLPGAQQQQQQQLQSTHSAPIKLQAANSTFGSDVLSRQEQASPGQSPFSAVRTPAAVAMLVEHETLRSQLSANLKSLNLSGLGNSLRTPSTLSAATGPSLHARPDSEAAPSLAGAGGQPGRVLLNAAGSSGHITKLEPDSQAGRLPPTPSGLSAPLPHVNRSYHSAPLGMPMRSISGPAVQAGPDSQAIRAVSGLPAQAEYPETASTLLIKLKSMTAECAALRHNLIGMMDD